MPNIGGNKRDYRLPIMASRATAMDVAKLHERLYYTRTKRRSDNLLVYGVIIFLTAFMAAAIYGA